MRPSSVTAATAGGKITGPDLSPRCRPDRRHRLQKAISKSLRSALLPLPVRWPETGDGNVPCPHGSRAASQTSEASPGCSPVPRRARHIQSAPAARAASRPPLSAQPVARLCGGHGTTGVPSDSEEQSYVPIHAWRQRTDHVWLSGCEY